jgi:hypothetical protein
MKTCHQCRIAFSIGHAGHYCTRACYDAARQGRLKGKEPPRVCLRCDTPFTPGHGLQSVCNACLNAPYASTLTHSQSPDAVQMRRDAFARVLRKHGIQWGVQDE